MPSRTAAETRAPEDLVALVVERATAEAGAWFPEFEGRPVTVRPRGGDTRSRCFLHRFEVSDGRRSRLVVVKVRHSRPHLRRVERCEDRPILSPVRILSDQHAARREFDGLELIRDAVAGQPAERFGVLRPLAWFPDHAAFLTDFVAEPTLRSVLLGACRLQLGRRERLDERPWRGAGAWLRLFHGQGTTLDLPPRTDTPAAVARMVDRYADFLRERLGGVALVERLRDVGPDAVRAALPATLPLAVGHGDFVAGNVFATPEGRVTGFDPLPMWRVPVHQDLATMVVGLRALPLKSPSLGLALPRGTLARCEAAFLHGYFDGEPVPRSALQVFELLVVLDRWAALAGRNPRRRRRPRRQEVAARVAAHHVEREATRLLDRLTGAPAGPLSLARG